MLLLAAGFVAYPFIASLTATDSNDYSDQVIGIVVDVNGLLPGSLMKTKTRGGDVWIYRRTQGEIAALDKLNPYVIDPLSRYSQQPQKARNPHRSLTPEFFVFIPYETKKDCQVSFVDARERTELSEWQGGFYEPCYQAYFDLAGRRYRNTGHTEQANLTVPTHYFRSPHSILLGEMRH